MHYKTNITSPDGWLRLCKEVAQSRGGLCLSESYINSLTRLEWQCQHGHTWLATPSNVIHKGSWCRTCAGMAKHTFEEFSELARLKGGELLSTAYIDIKQKLLWRCAKGHEWLASPGNMLQHGRWCPHCAKCAPLSIDYLRTFAKRRNGRIISTDYVNIDYKYTWECEYGHQWSASGYNISKGSWCPKCSVGASERLCIDIAEQLFSTAFPKSRPAWLRNSFGNGMELDGYCKRIGVAIEYHGKQHYECVSLFHSNKDSLIKRMMLDQEKRDICRQNGILLIEVPYTISRDQIAHYMSGYVLMSGFKVPMKNPDDVIPNDFVSSTDWNDRVDSIIGNRGKRLSNYVDSETKISIQCKCGIVFSQKISHLRNGVWHLKCPTRIEWIDRYKQKKPLSLILSNNC